MVGPSPAKTPMAPSKAARIDAGGFQRVAGAFEENALLRIDEFRFTRAVIEEFGVEPLHSLKRSRGLDVVRQLQDGVGDASRAQFFFRVEGYGFDAVAQVGPEFGDVLRAGTTRRHANYRDGRTCFVLVSYWFIHQSLIRPGWQLS